MGAYLSLSGSGRGWGWALIKFFCLQDGRLFEVGANSRLGAYSNKYGITSVLVANLILSSVFHVFNATLTEVNEMFIFIFS